MVDFNLYIPIDSVSFYLRKDPIVQELNTKNISLSSGYEIIPTDSNQLLFKNIDISHIIGNTISDGIPGIAQIIPQSESSVFFLLFLLCFILFVFITRFEGVSILSTIKNVFSFGRKESNIHKSQITISHIWGEIFLVMQTLLISTILVFVIGWHYGLSTFPIHNRFIIFLGLFLGMLVMLGLKLLVYKITGSILYKRDVDAWIERYLLCLEIVGIIAFIPVLFLVFIPEFRYAMIFILVILFVLSRIIILWSHLNIFVKHKIGLLYLIVYLCGVEIAPYILLISVGDFF